MNDALNTIVADAAQVEASREYAQRTLVSMDLTSLGDADTDDKIIDLCSRAVTPAGHVAAVCVYDQFVPLALDKLAGTGVKVATVCNFPHGNPDLAKAAMEARVQVESGVDEVDVVLPYNAYRAGDRDKAMAVICAVHEVCANKAKLKVIIESGELAYPELIEQASRDAINSGADFIKTSTGKVSVGATLDAAAVMLSVIKDMQPGIDRTLGFKPAGGMSTVADSAGYLFLADQIMGEGWATPETLRFGASSLLASVLDELGIATEPAAKSDY